MILSIPSRENREWKGIYQGRFGGNVWATKDIDFESIPGVARLSGRAHTVAQNDTAGTNFGEVLRFVKTTAGSGGTNRFYALTVNTGDTTAGKILVTPSVSFDGTWIADTNAGSPTNGVDMIAKGNGATASTEKILVALPTDIAVFGDSGSLSWDTDWWVTGKGQPPLNSGVYGHHMAKIGPLVAVCDNRSVHTIDKSDVIVNSAISLEGGLKTFRCVYASPNRFWFGVENSLQDRQSSVIEWDGFSRTYNKEYPFNGTPMAGFIFAGIPFFINQFYQILKFNGEGFSVVSQFPIQDLQPAMANATVGGLTSGILPNSCIVDGEVVRIVISYSHPNQRVRGGVWTFNPANNNLYHSYSVGDTTADFGQGYMKCGTIMRVDSLTGNGKFLVGASYYKSYPDLQKNAIMSLEAERESLATEPTNRGYIVTPWIPADRVLDLYESLWVIFRKFVHDDNHLVLKYRTSELYTRGSNYAMIAMDTNPVTWVSATQFKGIVPSTVKIGYEMEVIAGQNSGCLFHVSAFDTDPDDTTVVTVTIDESAPFSDTALTSAAQFDNWTKIEDFSDTDISFHNFPLTGSDSDGNPLNTSTRAQFKLELRGKAMEIEQLLLATKDALGIE